MTKIAQAQRTLAVYVVVGQLRRANVAIKVHIDQNVHYATEFCRLWRLGSILCSCTRARDLDFARQIVASIRKRGQDDYRLIVLVVGGSALNADSEIQDETCVDFVANDTAHALNISKPRRAGWLETEIR